MYFANIYKLDCLGGGNEEFLMGGVKEMTKREYIYYVNNFANFVGKAILEPK